MFVVQWLLLALWVLFDEGKEERAKRHSKNTMTLAEEQAWLRERQRKRVVAEKAHHALLERKKKFDDDVWIAKQKQKREDLKRRMAMDNK